MKRQPKLAGEFSVRDTQGLGIQSSICESKEEKGINDMTTSTERAILAGGCFWGMQDLIRRYPGVISTRVGALAEVVTDDFNGFLVEPRSAEQLAAALQRVAEPPTFARLVENVRKQNVSADEEIRKR